MICELLILAIREINGRHLVLKLILRSVFIFMIFNDEFLDSFITIYKSSSLTWVIKGVLKKVVKNLINTYRLT